MGSMDTDLDYNYTPDSGILGDDKSNPDINNEPVLQQVLQELKTLKSQYQTVDRLNLEDKNFSVEQQLELNKRFVVLLGTVELIINEKLKEFNSGR